MSAYLSLSAWLISLPSLWIVVCVRNFDRFGWRNKSTSLFIHGGWFRVYNRTNLNTIHISSLIDINGLNGSEGDWLCGEPGLVSSSFFFFPNRSHWIGQDWSVGHFSSLWIVICFGEFQVLVFDHIRSNVWRSVSPNTCRPVLVMKLSITITIITTIITTIVVIIIIFTIIILLTGRSWWWSWLVAKRFGGESGDRHQEEVAGHQTGRLG